MQRAKLTREDFRIKTIAPLSRMVIVEDGIDDTVGKVVPNESDACMH